MSRSEHGSSGGVNTFETCGYRDPLFETDDAERVRYEHREEADRSFRLWAGRPNQWLSSDTVMEIEQ